MCRILRLWDLLKTASDLITIPVPGGRGGRERWEAFWGVSLQLAVIIIKKK